MYGTKPLQHTPGHPMCMLPHQEPIAPPPPPGEQWDHTAVLVPMRRQLLNTTTSLLIMAHQRLFTTNKGISNTRQSAPTMLLSQCTMPTNQSRWVVIRITLQSHRTMMHDIGLLVGIE